MLKISKNNFSTKIWKTISKSLKGHSFPKYRGLDVDDKNKYDIYQKHIFEGLMKEFKLLPQEETIQNYEVYKFSEELGQTGNVWRCSYNTDENPETQSIVVKNSGVLIYKTIAESFFLEKIGSAFEHPKMPALHGYAIFENTNFNLLFIEDFKNTAPFDFEKGVPGNVLWKIIEVLATFHAVWRGKPELNELKHIFPINNSNVMGYYSEYEQQRHYLHKSKKLTFADREFIELLNKKREAYIHELAKLERTIVHGDLWLNNILFDKSIINNPNQKIKREDVKIIDWQDVGQCTGVLDLATLLLFSVDSKFIQSRYQEYLRFYHEELLKNGVTNYTFQQCLDDFHFALPLSFMLNVTALDTEFRSPEEEDRIILQLQICREFLKNKI